MAVIHGPFYRLGIYLAIALLVVALILLFIILVIEYIAKGVKEEYPAGDAITDEDGDQILDEIAAAANPNAEWVAGRVRCINEMSGPACNESE